MNKTGSHSQIAVKVRELTVRAQNSGHSAFSFFLDERECAGVAKLDRHWDDRYLLYGGYTGAQRCILGIFPAAQEPDTTGFPIVGMTFTYRAADLLTHRDFLGAFMALNITRETVGDILISRSGGRAVAFFYTTVADCVMQEITKIGSVGVKVSAGAAVTEDMLPRFEEIHAFVASARLDAVLSAAVKLSRGKSADLISRELVRVNAVVCTKPEKLLDPGEVLSVRGYGKFCFAEICGKSSKERIHIRIKKYL